MEQTEPRGRAVCPCCGQECDEAALKSGAALRYKWGSKINADGEPVDYTESELLELERSYEQQAAEYKGVITPRIELALQEISINRLEWRKAISSGDSTAAKRFADSISTIMAREGMRAGDGKASETPQIDSIIVGLERAGMLDEYGTVMASDKLMPMIAKALMRSYGVSRDVVDAMIFSIINTMAGNNAMPEYTELPKSAQLTNRGGQLRETMNRDEREAMESLGLTAPVREK